MLLQFETICKTTRSDFHIADCNDNIFGMPCACTFLI